MYIWGLLDVDCSIFSSWEGSRSLVWPGNWVNCEREGF